MIVNMFRESPWPGSMLSNFAETPFVIDGINCACSESFIQSLKISSASIQEEFCTLSGQEAWQKGSTYTEEVFSKGNIWWLGKPYILHSEEHFSLVKRGLLCKFEQSKEAQIALLATGNAELIHDYGQKPGKKQSLTVNIFCKIVSEIRNEFKKKNA